MRFTIRALLLILCTQTLTGCIFANIDLSPETQPYTETVIKSGSGKKIALIDITGGITDHTPSAPIFGVTPESMMKRVIDQLHKAKRDDDVAAIVLKIDSPGGSVTASDLIHREIMKIKTQTDKKVVAVLMDTAASGGYYVAVAADKIIAHPTTVTGSIGVIMQTFNLKGLLEKIGVEVEPIKSAPKKDIGSPFRASTKSEKAVLQAIIDEMYVEFLQKVKAGRPGLKLSTLKQMADGRVFTGRVALKAGFVDKVGYIEDSFTMAAEMAGVSNPKIVRYHRENETPASIHARAPTLKNTPIINVDLGSILAPMRPGFYYYWMPGHSGLTSR
jgi:protease IV